MTFPIIIDRWYLRPRRRSGPLLHSRPKSVIFPIVTAFWSRLAPPKRFQGNNFCFLDYKLYFNTKSGLLIIIQFIIILYYIAINKITYQKRRGNFQKLPLNNSRSIFLLEKAADRTNFRWQTTQPRRSSLHKSSRWWQLGPHSSSLKTSVYVDGLRKPRWRSWSHRILLNWFLFKSSQIKIF